MLTFDNELCATENIMFLNVSVVDDFGGGNQAKMAVKIDTSGRGNKIKVYAEDADGDGGYGTVTIHLQGSQEAREFLGAMRNLLQAYDAL